MAIAEQIDEIIRKRHERVPEVEKKIEQVRAALEVVDDIDAIKRGLFDPEGNLNPESEYYALFSGNPELVMQLQTMSTESFRTKANMLVAEYEQVKNRFSREYINIAAVGKARQGKSRFLQAVTGLDDKCIPAFDSGHCTGARSTVENYGGDLVAEITFKNENEMLEEVNKYMELLPKPERLTSLDDLPKQEGNVNSALTNPDLSTAVKTKLGVLKKRYIEHFEDWHNSIGAETAELIEEDKIMRHVAQYNGKEETDPGYEAFYRFVAVKSARIKTNFPHADAGRIKMIDTVGLGDSAVGIDTDMINTIRMESDAAVFIVRPILSEMNPYFESDMITIGGIEKEFKNKKMDKWFAYFFNHTRDVSEKIRENGEFCIKFKEHLDAINSPKVMSEIVDVSDADAVKEKFLVPLLEKLAKNIKEIDDSKLENVKWRAEDTWAEYHKMCQGMENIQKATLTGGGNSYTLLKRELIPEIKSAFMGGLYTLYNSYAKNKGEQCEVLTESIHNIITGMLGMIPDETVIAQKMKAAMNPAQVAAVYSAVLDDIRLRVTEKFIDVDVSLENMVKDFKNQIAELLINIGRLGKILPLSENEEPLEWLKRFSEEKLEGDDLRQLRIAFKFLYDFKLTVRSSLMNRVRSSLYEIGPTNQNRVKDLNFANMERSIFFNLNITLNKVKENLNREMGNFLIFPNESLFAACDEFYDRVSSTVAESAWDQIYSDNAWLIWQDELTEQAHNKAVCENWNKATEGLRKYDNKACFLIQ